MRNYAPPYDPIMRRGYVGSVYMMHGTNGALHLSYCDECSTSVAPEDAEAHTVIHLLQDAP